MYGDDYDERNDRPATEAEAHVEWHINSGVPMGTPGCPQDACHGPDEYDGYDIEQATDEAEYQKGVRETQQAQAAGPPGSEAREQAYREMEAQRDRDEVYHGLGEIDGGDGDDLPF